MKQEFSVKCPTCKESFRYYDSKFRPFCCEKCKMIDMGHWFDESYTINGRTNSIYIEEPEMLERLLNETNEDF